MRTATKRIAPQPGPQTDFLASPADIVIYGGAAGGGKTWALCAEPLRHIKNKHFTALILRRNATQIFNPGGLWDETFKLYPQFGGEPRLTRFDWVFPSGAYIRFGHLAEESSIYSYQGGQIAFLAFDELSHFTESQFFYMLSRNRSTCGVRPYIRATTNPDADSWVAKFIDWWIGDDGYPIRDRSGVLRWFVRVNNQLDFADTPEELIDKHGSDAMPKSLTFIPANLYDNKILMDANPEYLANLKGLAQVDRERLLYGNWKIKPTAGLYFRRSWVQFVDAAPSKLRRVVRYWDLAGTPYNGQNDPDKTVGVKMGMDNDGQIYILDLVSMMESPAAVRQAIKNTANYDGTPVWVGIPQDPGQAGKSQVIDLTRLLHGYTVRAQAETGDKITRFSPFSAQCEAGNVTIVRASWNDELIQWLEGFPDARYKDYADACSGAYALLAERTPPLNVSPTLGRMPRGGRFF